MMIELSDVVLGFLKELVGFYLERRKFGRDL